MCMTVICFGISFYTFSSSTPASLEELCKATVYLSLAVGNVVMVLVSVRTAVHVVRHYQTMRKGRSWHGGLGSSPSPVKSLEFNN